MTGCAISRSTQYQIHATFHEAESKIDFLPWIRKKGTEIERYIWRQNWLLVHATKNEKQIKKGHKILTFFQCNRQVLEENSQRNPSSVGGHNVQKKVIMKQRNEIVLDPVYFKVYLEQKKLKITKNCLQGVPETSIREECTILSTTEGVQPNFFVVIVSW